MNPEQNNSFNTPGNTTHGSDFLTPDAGPDTSRGDYSAVNEADLNDSSHDDENVDVPVPDTFSEDEGGNVVDRQMGIISRLPG